MEDHETRGGEAHAVFGRDFLFMPKVTATLPAPRSSRTPPLPPRRRTPT
jgi:hypothetical protein